MNPKVRKDERLPLSSWRLSLLLGTILVLVIGLAWKKLVDYDLTKVHGIVKRGAEYRQEEIFQALTERKLAVERMAVRLSIAANTREIDWKVDAELYLKHYEDVQSLFVVDADGKRRWSVSKANTDGRTSTFVPEEHWFQDKIKIAIESTQAYTEFLSNPRKGYYTIVSPIFHDGFTEGHTKSIKRYVIQVVDLSTILLEALRSNFFQFEVREKSDVLFNNLSENGKLLAEKWGVTLFVPLAPTQLELRAVPTPQMLHSSRDQFASYFLFSGLLISGLLVITFQRALTAKIRANEALSLNTKLQTVMSLAPVGIFQTDLEGKCLYVNKAWSKMTGISDTEALGDGWAQVLHPDDQERIASEWTASTRDRKAYEAVFRFLARGGRTVWVHCQSALLSDHSGEPFGFLGAVQDFTERRQAEEMAEAHRTRMVYSEKMISLGEMAGGIAHEINNPLAIIKGNADLLVTSAERGVIDQAMLSKLAGKITSTVDRIAKIINGLRVFARDGEKDTFERVKVKSFVDETLEFCFARFRSHNVEIEVGNFSADIEMECRRVQMSQVLLNLLNNSLDAVQGTARAFVRIDVQDRGESIEISVTDSGRGIPKEILPKLMQPFFTTKSVGKGTGLGLSISKGIVESHQGTLVVDTLCANTRFVLSFPKKQMRDTEAA